MPPEPSGSRLAPGLVQVVADPNVLVSAALTPGGVCADLLTKLLESPLELVASPLLLDEVERVLWRPRFDHLPPALRASYVEFLRRITRSEADPPPTGGPLVAADTRDDYLVRLTLAGDRRLLVTGDRHLLDLAGGYPIVSPRELLDRLVAEGRVTPGRPFEPREPYLEWPLGGSTTEIITEGREDRF